MYIRMYVNQTSVCSVKDVPRSINLPPLQRINSTWRFLCDMRTQKCQEYQGQNTLSTKA